MVKALVGERLRREAGAIPVVGKEEESSATFHEACLVHCRSECLLQSDDLPSTKLQWVVWAIDVLPVEASVAE